MDEYIETPLNSGSAPEVKERILERAAIEAGHTTHLELVCCDWYNTVKGDRFQTNIGKIVILTLDNYHGKIEECVARLSRNKIVTHLTIHYPNKSYEDYFDFWSLIYQGLTNKPNLIFFEIVGHFEVQSFFQKKNSFEVLKDYKKGEFVPTYSKFLEPKPEDLDCWSIVNCPPKDLLRYPHVSFFSNLKEFRISGYVVGPCYTDVYFVKKFLSSETLPNLKIFSTRMQGISFDRNEEFSFDLLKLPNTNP
jgi:hypothetical protein